MTSVEINAGGRFVRVIQDGRDAELLMPLAQKAWESTEGASEEEKPGGAVGFRDERRWTPDVDPMASRGFSEPVKAKEHSAHSV